MEKRLTPKQEKFLQALLIAPSVTEASKMAGIARSTGQKYLTSVTFKRAYREHTSQLMKQTTGKLQKASLEAVEVLREIMLDSDNSPYARQQAAQTILTTAYKAHEVDNVLEVIEELEARFDNEVKI